MLYPDLQNVRSCYSEIKFWKKAVTKAGAADVLTSAGLRKCQKLDSATSCLAQANADYAAAKEKVLQNELFQNMMPYLKDACIEYYFKAQKQEVAESIYGSTSFLRDVRNYCHKI